MRLLQADYFCSLMPTILAIESSCDDTSAAVLKDGVVRSNLVANQEVHKKYGGVVPELASRAHLQHIVPVVAVALQEAGLSLADVDAVAFTQSPGLIGSLHVGASFAKGLAQAMNKKLIAVHHMQAHVLAHFIEDPKPAFPFLCLTVSGGHTQLVLVHEPLRMEIIGQTLDDAAGEAFDKTAKMLGLPYPGGPLIDKNAQAGNPERFSFPLSQVPGFDFSFSGIKTSILQFLDKQTRLDKEFVVHNLADICASVQHTIIRMLMQKLEQAAIATGVHHIGIAGGVSANSGLRQAVTSLAKRQGWQAYIPRFAYCTDNAAMIGMAAHFKYLEQDFASLDSIPMARSEWV